MFIQIYHDICKRLSASIFLFEGVNLRDLLGVIFEVASQSTGDGFCAGDGRGGVLMFLSGFGQIAGHWSLTLE